VPPSWRSRRALQTLNVPHPQRPSTTRRPSPQGPLDDLWASLPCSICPCAPGHSVLPPRPAVGVGTGRVERLALAFRILDELRRGPQRLRRSTPTPSRMAASGNRLEADVYRAALTGRVPLILVPGLVEAGRNDPQVPPSPGARPCRVPGRGSGLLPSGLARSRQCPELAAARGGGRAARPGSRTGGPGCSASPTPGIALLVAIDSSRAGRIPSWPRRRTPTRHRRAATGHTVHRGRLRVVGQALWTTGAARLTRSSWRMRDGGVRVHGRPPAARHRAALADLADSLSPQGRVIYDLFETATPNRSPA
jgi:hypothetical protein